MASTGSSDAHELDVVGCYFTEFDVPIETIADFVGGPAQSPRPPAAPAWGPTWLPVRSSKIYPFRSRRVGDAKEALRPAELAAATSAARRGAATVSCVRP